MYVGQAWYSAIEVQLVHWRVWTHAAARQRGRSVLSKYSHYSCRLRATRSNFLALFFSGLGYIVGSAAAKAGGSWQWALRVSNSWSMCQDIVYELVVLHFLLFIFCCIRFR